MTTPYGATEEGQPSRAHTGSLLLIHLKFVSHSNYYEKLLRGNWQPQEKKLRIDMRDGLQSVEITNLKKGSLLIHREFNDL